MSSSDMLDLRKEIEQLPTSNLEALLRAELDKAVPDDQNVLTILHILEDREAEQTLEMTLSERKAFEFYKQRVSSRRKKRIFFPRLLSVAASVVLILGILFALVPQQAEAETFWEMLQRWSSTVVEFLSREERLVDKGYSFKTDNPGLQQVYDAVAELGVTDPVVPMWIPEGFELDELNTIETPMLKGIFAGFINGENEIAFKMDLFDGEPAHQYYKDDSHNESYEKNGTIFHITKNIDEWVVVWTIDNVECSIFIDCQEDTLRRILESIYNNGG